MRRLVATLILRVLGWKINNVIPPGTKKCIIAVAPHTSYWDFVIGRLAYWKMGIKAKFLIKREAFKFPFNILLKNLGGIPVDRGKSNKMVDQIADMFKKSKELIVVITPEGTRKPVKHWKKGFYYIANKAQVPIALAYINWGKKEGGVGKIMDPNGNIDEQLAEMMDFYRTMVGKHPERFKLHEK